VRKSGKETIDHQEGAAFLLTGGGTVFSDGERKLWRDCYPGKERGFVLCCECRDQKQKSLLELRKRALLSGGRANLTRSARGKTFRGGGEGDVL